MSKNTSAEGNHPQEPISTSPKANLTSPEKALIGMTIVFFILVLAVVIWFATYLSKRKKSKEQKPSDLSSVKSVKVDYEKKATATVSKKAKDERQKEAAMLQKQTWMQQLQILQYQQMSEQTYPVLVDLLEDQKHTLNYINLKREAARLISMRRQFRRGDQRTMRSIREMREAPEIIRYLRGIADEALEQKEIFGPNRLIVNISGCRSEKIRLRIDTEVKLNMDPYPKSPKSKELVPLFAKPRTRQPGRLHMNKLKDYYGKTLILCQAPLPSQFADQWQAIWEQNVGVLVWIGSFVEMGKVKMNAYIALTEGGRVACGEFRIQTMFVARFKEDQFDVYRVSVTFDLLARDNIRELIVVHVHMWPDHRVPDEPAQLADLVAQVQGHQLKQAMHKLPGLLVHCSVGVQRSPAFLAVYICRQIWMVNRRANIFGVLRYIRRQRFGAFGYGDPFAQVQIVFGVMQVIAMRQEMEGIGSLNVAADEERVFDRKARMADNAAGAVADKTKILG